MLRTISNYTYASWIHDFDLTISLRVKINHKGAEQEKLISANFDGVLILLSELDNQITLQRTLAPKVICRVTLL